MSRVCYVWGLLCLSLLCLGFVCLGFVVSSVCVSRVGYGNVFFPHAFGLHFSIFSLHLLFFGGFLLWCR